MQPTIGGLVLRAQPKNVVRSFGQRGLFGPGKLADNSVRTRARQRLFEAFQAIHLRGEAHITIRELRASLVYILFGIHYCSDYHKSGNGPDSLSLQSYSERAFSLRSSSRQGDVLRELVRFDPALEAHPQLDRRLLHPPSRRDESGSPLYYGLTLEAARRRAYFEWAQNDLNRLTGDPNALDLAQGRHLRQFLFLATEDDRDRLRELTKSLCAGISRLEALPSEALARDGVVPLKIAPRTPTETAFWVEKPVDNFRLEADMSRAEGLDWLHRQAILVYCYRDGRKEKLRLGADLFHLLLELSDGYQLGDVATDDTFAHLSIFVQRLVQEDHRQIFAWSPMREDAIFRVSAEVYSNEASPQQLMIIDRVEIPKEWNAK